MTSAGGVVCWGSNELGQLGNGAIGGVSGPVAVQGVSSSVIAIAAGYDHTCALGSGGGVECWGYNGQGQLGDGSKLDSAAPVGVVGLGSGIARIESGPVADTTCAVTATGRAMCWGFGDAGNLGDGLGSSSDQPVEVVGLASDAAAIAVGSRHTCALMEDAHVACWGSNDSGELGNGSTQASDVPVEVSGL